MSKKDLNEIIESVWKDLVDNGHLFEAITDNLGGMNGTEEQMEQVDNVAQEMVKRLFGKDAEKKSWNGWIEGDTYSTMLLSQMSQEDAIRAMEEFRDDLGLDKKVWVEEATTTRKNK